MKKLTKLEHYAAQRGKTVQQAIDDLAARMTKIQASREIGYSDRSAGTSSIEWAMRSSGVSADFQPSKGERISVETLEMYATLRESGVPAGASAAMVAVDGAIMIRMMRDKMPERYAKVSRRASVCSAKTDRKADESRTARAIERSLSGYDL